MAANAYWAQFGWDGDDATLRPVAMLNGGIRRAVNERYAFQSRAHYGVVQKYLLEGIASTDSTACLDMSAADFRDHLADYFPDEAAWGLKDSLTYLRRRVQNNSDLALLPEVSPSGEVSSLAHMIDRLPSQWESGQGVSADFLVEDGVVEIVDGAYRAKPFWFLPLREGYALARRVLDDYRWLRTSICPWMAATDVANKTITASADLLAICPNGYWLTWNTYDTTYYLRTKYALTDLVPCSDIYSGGRYRIALYLDGWQCLRFGKDTTD